MQNFKKEQVDVLWHFMESYETFPIKLFEGLPQLWRKDILLEEEKSIQITKTYARAMLLRLMDRHQISEHKINHTFWGKPYITGEFSFTISHSKNLVTVAGGSIKTLGIDVENHKAISLEELDGCFTPAEIDIIRKDPSPDRKTIHYWCCKEAALKADGRGLSVPMDSVTVSPAMDTATIEVLDNYILIELPLHQDYACWLALPDKNIALHVEQFHPGENT